MATIGPEFVSGEPKIAEFEAFNSALDELLQNFRIRPHSETPEVTSGDRVSTSATTRQLYPPEDNIDLGPSTSQSSSTKSALASEKNKQSKDNSVVIPGTGKAWGQLSLDSDLEADKSHRKITKEVSDDPGKKKASFASRVAQSRLAGLWEHLSTLPDLSENAKAGRVRKNKGKKQVPPTLPGDDVVTAGTSQADENLKTDDNLIDPKTGGDGDRNATALQATLDKALENGRAAQSQLDIVNKKLKSAKTTNQVLGVLGIGSSMVGIGGAYLFTKREQSKDKQIADLQSQVQAPQDSPPSQQYTGG